MPISDLKLRDSHGSLTFHRLESSDRDICSQKCSSMYFITNEQFFEMGEGSTLFGTL